MITSLRRSQGSFFTARSLAPQKRFFKIKKTAFLEALFWLPKNQSRKGFFHLSKTKQKPAPFGVFFFALGWCDSKKAKAIHKKMAIGYPRCKLAYGKQESKSGIHLSISQVEKKHPGSYMYTKPPFRNPAVAVLEP